MIVRVRVGAVRRPEASARAAPATNARRFLFARLRPDLRRRQKSLPGFQERRGLLQSTRRDIHLNMNSDHQNSEWKNVYGENTPGKRGERRKVIWANYSSTELHHPYNSRNRYPIPYRVSIAPKSGSAVQNFCEDALDVAVNSSIVNIDGLTIGRIHKLLARFNVAWMLRKNFKD